MKKEDINKLVNNETTPFNLILEKDKEIEILNNIINELDRGYKDLFEHDLVPGRELIANIKNIYKNSKELIKSENIY